MSSIHPSINFSSRLSSVDLQSIPASQVAAWNELMARANSHRNIVCLGLYNCIDVFYAAFTSFMKPESLSPHSF